MTHIFYFFLWTFILYWIHRIGHNTPIIRDYHLDHHRFILTHNTKWHWNNLFLFNDTWNSTIDLWLTEVIPTIVFSIVTGEYWLSLFYYIWAAFIQETIEHNQNFDIPLLTSGKWHLIHHRSSYNYGLFFPTWDLMFGTYKRVHE